jgi:hypothetical protein
VLVRQDDAHEPLEALDELVEVDGAVAILVEVLEISPQLERARGDAPSACVAATYRSARSSRLQPAKAVASVLGSTLRPTPCFSSLGTAMTICGDSPWCARSRARCHSRALNVAVQCL